VDEELVTRPPPIFRVRAHNTSADSENKIHDDRVAAAHGFRGGLVPGVEVYGYMVPAILDQFGHDWMARGGINVRFIAPCYEGETVIARCSDSTVTAETEDGSVYASGVVTLRPPDTAATESWAHEVYPVHPLPAREQRPVASAQTVIPGIVLGTLRRKLEAETQAEVPRVLLHLANEVLGQNFKMSPWIHAGSEVRHHRMPEIGQEITVTGLIQECFERKGRRFAVAGIGYAQNDSLSPELVASVRHTFIYDLGDPRNRRS
jgi:acyl dehydratase